MNSKQKVGYMALGAAILAVGIVIGQLVTPDITAQNNGVFDEIRCSKLTVVDKAGNTAVKLTALEDMNFVSVFDKTGNAAVRLVAMEDSNYVSINDKSGKLAVSLGAKANEDKFVIIGRPGEKTIKMLTGKGEHEHLNHILVFDRAGNATWQAP